MAHLTKKVEKKKGLLDEELLKGAIGAGREGIAQAREAAGRGFEEIAEEQITLLRERAAPRQERERKALEARLLAQGRLGASSGALAQQAQQEGFSLEDLQAQLAGRELAQDERQQLFGMGLNLAEFGLGANAREVGLGFEGQALQLQRAAAEAARKKSKGPGFLKSALGAIAPAIGGAFGGPLGAAAGRALVGAMTKPKQ